MKNMCESKQPHNTIGLKAMAWIHWYNVNTKRASKQAKYAMEVKYVSFFTVKIFGLPDHKDQAGLITSSLSQDKHYISLLESSLFV